MQLAIPTEVSDLPRSVRGKATLPWTAAFSGGNGIGMRMYIAVCAALLATAVGAGAAERLRFWNLTAGTITELSLASAGTTNWGPNQCRNDPDGAVDHDERLDLEGCRPRDLRRAPRR